MAMGCAGKLIEHAKIIWFHIFLNCILLAYKVKMFRIPWRRRRRGTWWGPNLRSATRAARTGDGNLNLWWKVIGDEIFKLQRFANMKSSWFSDLTCLWIDILGLVEAFLWSTLFQVVLPEAEVLSTSPSVIAEWNLVLKWKEPLFWVFSPML